MCYPIDFDRLGFGLGLGLGLPNPNPDPNPNPNPNPNPIDFDSFPTAEIAEPWEVAPDDPRDEVFHSP